MLFGIIGFAVGIEEIVAHPGDPLHSDVLIALGTGVALFVGISAVVYWRISGTILVARVVAILVMAAGLALVSSLPPAWPLAVVAIALTAVVTWEYRWPPAVSPLLEDAQSPDRPDRPRERAAVLLGFGPREGSRGVTPERARPAWSSA